jgi:hypothetical protein
MGNPSGLFSQFTSLKWMVGRAGFEPATLCLKGRYSTTELTALLINDGQMDIEGKILIVNY